jgi:hypothetical protein
MMITLIIVTTYSFSLFTSLSIPIYAQQDLQVVSIPIYVQQDLQVVKSKNLQIELDDNLTTNAQLTFPVRIRYLTHPLIS